jgi:hypothetical protein
VPNAADAAELLDVEVEQLAGAGSLVTLHRLGRDGRLEAAQAGALQDAGDRGIGSLQTLGDAPPGPARLAQLQHQGAP